MPERGSAIDVDGKTCLLRNHEAISNPEVPHSLLSDFQVKERTHKLDATFKHCGGTQSWHLTSSDEVPLKLRACMAVVPHRTPTEEEIAIVKPIDITCEGQWDPNAFHDDLHDDFQAEVNKLDEEDEELDNELADVNVTTMQGSAPSPCDESDCSTDEDMPGLEKKQPNRTSVRTIDESSSSEDSLPSLGV